MEHNYDYYHMFDTPEVIKARKECERRLKAKARKEKMTKVKDKIVKGLATVLFVGVPTIVAVTPAVKAITGAVKSANRRSIVQTEKESKETYCYDRSLGHYWELKRKLSNQDWVEINRRKGHGEKLADILADMNVLK